MKTPTTRITFRFKEKMAFGGFFTLLIVVVGAVHGLTEEQQLMLDKHNEFRANVKPCPTLYRIAKLTWNPLLEKAARLYAPRCDWKHTDRKFVKQVTGIEGWVGENLFGAPTGKFKHWSVAAEYWANEDQFYNYCTNKCEGGECGHYLQLVWFDSTSVGCAMQKCDHDKMKGMDYVVCFYHPGGNDAGRPFRVSNETFETHCNGGKLDESKCKKVVDIPAKPVFPKLELTEEQQYILDYFNEARAGVTPCPTIFKLNKLTWSRKLEKAAQAWVDQCKNGDRDHDMIERITGIDRMVGATSDYWSTGKIDFRNVTEYWRSQGETYDYCTNGCGRNSVCDSYVAMIWDETTHIGCAKKSCALDTQYPGKDLFFCFYFPPGNRAGVRPFSVSPEIHQAFCSGKSNNVKCDNTLGDPAYNEILDGPFLRKDEAKEKPSLPTSVSSELLDGPFVGQDEAKEKEKPSLPTSVSSELTRPCKLTIAFCFFFAFVLFAGNF